MGVDVLNAIPAQNVDSYRAIFEGYINARADHLMQVVQRTDFVDNANEHEKLMHVLNYALESPDSWLTLRELLLAAAPLMQRIGYRHEWIPCLQKGIAKCTEYDDLQSQARLHYELGFIFQAMGQLHDAQGHYEIGISKIDCGQKRSIYAKLVNKLAFVKRLQQLHDESKQLILGLLPQLEPTESEYGTSHLVLGWIAFDKQNWEKSEYHFRKALDTWDAESNPLSYASGLRDLASVLQMQQKYDEAVDHYLKSLQFFEEISESHQSAVATMNLGVVYLFRRQPQQALDHFINVEPKFRHIQDLHHLALVYLNKGIAYRELAQMDLSICNLLSAIKIWEQIGSVDMLVNMFDELGVTYTKANCRAEAVSTFNWALVYLEQIKDKQIYDYYRNEVETHLAGAEVQQCTSAP